MTCLTMLMFLFTHICWAFFPDFVSWRMPDDSNISLGVWFTVATVLTAILLSACYSLVLGKHLDAENQQLIEELSHEQ